MNKSNSATTLLMFCLLAVLCLEPRVGMSQAATEGSKPAHPEAAEATPVDIAKTIDLVQKAYSKLKTLSAKFSQTSSVPIMGGQTRSETGTLELMTGGLMRWEFITPENKLFVSDGNTLWFYVPAEKQVVVTPLQTGASRTALNFMFGLGDLRKEFDAAAPEESGAVKPGLSAIHLTPREPLGTIKDLTIYVSEEDGMVREAEIHDHMGSTTQIVFSDLRINQDIPRSRFEFEKPDDVRKIDTAGM